MNTNQTKEELLGVTIHRLEVEDAAVCNESLETTLMNTCKVVCRVATV